MKKAVFILAAAVLIYIAASLWISSEYLIVNEYPVDLGLSGDGIRAVVISDLHDHEFGKDNEKLVNKVRETDPDLILMDGDMLNSDSAGADIPLTLIRQLKDTAPVYYAMGNQELSYMENGHEDLPDQLRDAGAVILEKNYEDIEINGSRIRLGGMYDYAFGFDSQGNNDALSAPEDIRSFLEKFQNTDRTRILLCHRPDSFVFGNAASVWDVDLVVSGHDHGGQIVVPFLGGMYGGDQGWFPEYIHGLYEKDRIRLFVTSGLATDREKLPRFNNPPEIAVLSIQ